MEPIPINAPSGEIPEELQAKLKAPLPPEAITANDKHSHLSSIKPAFVIERMNEVFGIGGYVERYREISMTTKEVVYHKGTNNERKSMLFVATVHGTLTIPKYGVHLENFGGSENENAGDELKGACTDAFTKMCSHLGVGLEVYKGKYDKQAASLPPCPNCNKPLRKDKDGNGYFCWKAKGGCGANFSEEGLKATQEAKAETEHARAAKKAPASAAGPQDAAPHPDKKTICALISDIREHGGRLFVQIGSYKCTAMQDDIKRRFFGKKGWEAEVLVAQIESKDHGTVYQIAKVIGIEKAEVQQ